MKKLFLSAMFAVMALGASAQQQPAKTFSISPHLGLGYAVYGGGKLGNTDIAGGIDASLGVEAVYKFNNWFGLGLGLDFGYFSSDEQNYYSHEYYTIDLPLIAHFDVSRHFSIFAGVGGTFMTRANEKFQDHNGTEVTEKINSFNTATLFIPVGIKFTFNKPWTLAIQGNIGATRWNKYDLRNANDIRLTPIMLTLGYRFDL